MPEELIQIKKPLKQFETIGLACNRPPGLSLLSRQGEMVMKKSLAWVAAGLFLGVVLFSAQSPTTVEAAQGSQVYTEKCAPCHGPDGEGKGPMAVAFNPKPASFHDPKFWQGDVAKKITDTVNNGKGQMIPVSLSDAEMKAVIEYMTQTFKK
jgi:mono/diheme cytochrome c family protein